MWSRRWSKAKRPCGSLSLVRRRLRRRGVDEPCGGVISGEAAPLLRIGLRVAADDLDRPAASGKLAK